MTHTSSKLRRRIFGVLFSFSFWNVRRKLSLKLDAIEGLISTIETERARALKSGAINFVQIHDATLFLALLSYDLSILGIDQLIELRNARKNFYSRQLCLLIYEALEDLPEVLGKDFRQAVQNISTGVNLINGIGLCTKRLNEIRKKYAPELKEIRTFAAAHRDHNAHSQLLVIQKVDDKKIAQITAEIEAILYEIIREFANVVRQMGDTRVILQNIKGS